MLTQKFELRSLVIGPAGYGAIQVDQLRIFVVAGPVRQAQAVGIARAREVGPVAHHLLAQPAVFRTPLRAVPGVKRAEYVLKIIGVEGILALWMHLARRCGQFETDSERQAIFPFARELQSIATCPGR